MQSYLETFNKDLEGNVSGATVVRENVTAENTEDDDEGTYFVDESGNYYYQATKDSEPVLTEPPDGDNIQFIVEDDDQLEQATTSTAIGESIECAVTRSRKQNLQLAKNETSDYENISIVQSETDDGEVRYVFVTAEDDDVEHGAAEDEKEYEFEEEGIDTESDGAESPKKKANTRGPAKKTQNSSQLHMCSYCNYTSAKRYLLSRHMKSHSEERPYSK